MSLLSHLAAFQALSVIQHNRIVVMLQLPNKLFSIKLSFWKPSFTFHLKNLLFLYSKLSKDSSNAYILALFQEKTETWLGADALIIFSYITADFIVLSCLFKYVMQYASNDLAYILQAFPCPFLNIVIVVSKSVAWISDTQKRNMSLNKL